MVQKCKGVEEASASVGEEGADVGSSQTVAAVTAYAEAIGSLNSVGPVVLGDDRSRCDCGAVLDGGVHRAGADCLHELRHQVLVITDILLTGTSRDRVVAKLRAAGFVVKD